MAMRSLGYMPSEVELAIIMQRLDMDGEHTRTNARTHARTDAHTSRNTHIYAQPVRAQTNYLCTHTSTRVYLHTMHACTPTHPRTHL